MEIGVLKALDHPNIIHLADVFETETRIYMVGPSGAWERDRGGEGRDGWSSVRPGQARPPTTTMSHVPQEREKTHEPVLLMIIIITPTNHQQRQ